MVEMTFFHLDVYLIAEPCQRPLLEVSGIPLQAAILAMTNLIFALDFVIRFLKLPLRSVRHHGIHLCLSACRIEKGPVPCSDNFGSQARQCRATNVSRL